MRKLFGLKSWFTLWDASLFLGHALQEPVSEADILRLALDNKLKLSAVFVDLTLARVLTPVSEESLRFNEVPNLRGTGTLKLPIGGQVVYTALGAALQAQDDMVYALDEEAPYDLLMLGGERADVQRRYWDLVGTEMEETTNIDGTFVSQGGRFFQLMEQFKESAGHYPIGCLPSNCVLVLRREAILDLIKSVEPTPEGAELARSPTIAGRWPWGAYETENLRHLAAAADRWWKNFDPTDNTTAPTNAEVCDWLISRGVAQRTAEVMATILRVDGLRTGPRK